MKSFNQPKFCIDIVLVIGATQRTDGLIGLIKSNALRFYYDLITISAHRARHIDQFRVRIIAAQNNTGDRESILSSGFFVLPDESAAVAQFAESIKTNESEFDECNILKMLAYAMKSPWNSSAGDKYRHIITVFSDGETHKSGIDDEPSNYLKLMSKEFKELTGMWGDSSQKGIMNHGAKRLLIFAPDKGNWRMISDAWDSTIRFPVEDYDTIDYDQLLEAMLLAI